MKTRFNLLACTVLAAMTLAPTAQAQSTPPVLRFAPPAALAPDACFPRLAEREDDLDVEGLDDELTDEDRARYLRRDIRNLLRTDPVGEFAFIAALIERRVEVDSRFSDADGILALIDLHLAAGRPEELVASGLVPSLRERAEALAHRQRIALAQFYLDGIGVAPDPAYGQELLRETAYAGSPGALLEIARMEIRGEMIDQWDAPLDLTISMAMGGVLGALDNGICRRAERIAQEYERGEVVAADAELAFAWRKFAADMGDADAAWRIVEHHLNAPAAAKDNEELRHYLTVAANLGRRPSDSEAEALLESGAVTPEVLLTIVGFNHSQDKAGPRRSVAPYLDLIINVDGMEADEDGLYLDYLREIAEMPEAPGSVFTRLAQEVQVRRGRWAGEAEAMELLEKAVARGDGDGMAMLARMLMRYRDDPRRTDRAVSLLMETVSRHGMASSMHLLDGHYRCQVNDAPRMAEASHWAEAYHASDYASVTISATDLLALDPYREPEAIAKIQSQALQGRTTMLAAHVQRVQESNLPDAALRFWAGRLNGSDQALEAFSELEFELATSPELRDLSVELFRRVYLNNGVTTALDLAIALTEHNSRDPHIADEIVTLLTMAGNRGEGAAIRLLWRLTGRPGEDVYAQFADVIEKRGDFLALMYAIPYIPAAKLDDYIDRAVSLMNCGIKDAEELGDAYAIRGDMAMSYHWRQIGLQIEGGHVLSKLRLSDRQMAQYAIGRAPDPADVAARAQAEGDPGAALELFRLTSDPDLETYDPERAVAHLDELVNARTVDATSVLQSWRASPPAVRALVSAQLDMTPVLERAARTGEASAAFEYALHLRDQAETASDLVLVVDWLSQAARADHPGAMVELGLLQGMGPAALRDPDQALIWLDRAADLGETRAPSLAQMLRLGSGL
ncbi:hypothetical protein JANAI62_09070 [Jannaschia pagri]|uniref:TPR repeat n=1 Tax=Jannaschia pagri TaxID=2829797 RepID=A0ABQ4NIP2_9RHOB|nr:MULTISPECIES: hypothetical protein [unclassified Jannaschia]GIT89608.1 hypothetical protein JANAI61_00660 [Jannaschia sp. AI_61]GIT94284.1 hypothetical protein JANAI62_09070 [Jannaschia sp. AI_62]